MKLTIKKLRRHNTPISQCHNITRSQYLDVTISQKVTISKDHKTILLQCYKITKNVNTYLENKSVIFKDTIFMKTAASTNHQQTVSTIEANYKKLLAGRSVAYGLCIIIVAISVY